MKTTVAIALILLPLGVAAGQADSDGDGMPNDWEKQYGLNHTNAADAAVDTDGDGFTNLQEFEGRHRVSTNPTDNTSYPPLDDHWLYVSRIVLRGTNRWIQLTQYGVNPIWVKEGSAKGTANGVPDWKRPHRGNRIGRVVVDDSRPTEVRVFAYRRNPNGSTSKLPIHWTEDDRPWVVENPERESDANKSVDPIPEPARNARGSRKGTQ